MSRKNVMALSLVLSLVFFVIAYVYFSEQEIVVLESDFIDSHQFLLRNDAVILEGVLYLKVNDTRGL